MAETGEKEMRRPAIGYQFEALELPVATQQGVDLFVDTVRGATGGKGLSWANPLSTVEGAFDRLDSPRFFSAEFLKNATIHIIGDVREQFDAPDGLYGVKLVGAANGRPRHSTSGGAVVDGNGVSWRESATAENRSLLRIEGQGYEFHNILFVPESGYAAVRLYRTATDSVDASHAKFKTCRFSGGGSQVGIGIEDYGGQSHVEVSADCEFDNLEYGIYQSNAGIDWANRWLIADNFFRGNKNDIVLNSKMARILRNVFGTVYHATTHPKTVDMVGTADGSVANYVLDNYFADAAAAVLISKGYIPATGDIWRNYVADTAAQIVTVPTA